MTNSYSIHRSTGGRGAAMEWKVRESNSVGGDVFRAVQTGPKTLPDSGMIGAGYVPEVKRQKADPRNGTAAARLLGFRVRIRPEA